MRTLAGQRGAGHVVHVIVVIVVMVIAATASIELALGTATAASGAFGRARLMALKELATFDLFVDNMCYEK